MVNVIQVLGLQKALLNLPGTHTMDQCVKEILMGSDPLNIDLLWEKNLRRYSNDWAGRGAGVNAMSAVDMALWDKGKALNKPVYELLGWKEQELCNSLCVSSAS